MALDGLALDYISEMVLVYETGRPHRAKQNLVHSGFHVVFYCYNFIVVILWFILILGIILSLLALSYLNFIVNK